MDFGGFILFLLLAVGQLGGGLIVVAAFRLQSSQRWRGLKLWLGGLVVLMILGRWLYQVYWLDEGLFIAASRGDRARVEALLAAGASPNATWEDGRTSAISVARRKGRKDIVDVLRRAGAIEPDVRLSEN